jgi:excisionase family DNA binding protein
MVVFRPRWSLATKEPIFNIRFAILEMLFIVENFGKYKLRRLPLSVRHRNPNPTVATSPTAYKLSAVETNGTVTTTINLTIDEAAAELRCSRDTVTRLIQSGRLPAKDLGQGKHHNYRVRRGDLDLLNVAPPSQSRSPRRRPRTQYKRLA